MGRLIGHRADAQYSWCNVFYNRFCSPITFGVHVLHSWQMLRQVEIVKKYQSGYMFWYIAHAPYTRSCLSMHRLSMVFVLHAPLVFEQKIALIPSFLNRNWFANILTIATIVVHGTLCFAIENAAEPLVFRWKLMSTYFLSENQWNDDNFKAKQKVGASSPQRCAEILGGLKP